ncbi:MAG: DUF4405 domain-containing protein [Verrucomicrobiota bacterium]
MTLRKTTSLTTLLSFILLLISSVILYVTPQGKIAYWADWKILGLDKEQWGALHTNLGFLFILAGIIHIILNWKPIVAYLKTKKKKLKVFTPDFNIALAITLIITLFTLLEFQPIIAIQHFNEALKAAAAEKYGEPPYGHAEESPLESFCKRTGLDVKDSIQKLEKGGLESASAEATLAEIAEANGMTPRQVYDMIKPAEDKTDGGMPMKPGMGFGRKELSSVCESYDLDLQVTIEGLKGLGIEVSAEESIKEIAEKNDMEPLSIFEAIRQLQDQ